MCLSLTSCWDSNVYTVKAIGSDNAIISSIVVWYDWETQSFTNIWASSWEKEFEVKNPDYWLVISAAWNTSWYNENWDLKLQIINWGKVLKEGTAQWNILVTNVSLN